MEKHEFKNLAAELLSNARELLPRWFPEGRFRGREFVVGSIHGEKGESLSVNSETGAWSDFAGPKGNGGADLISLYAAKESLSQSKAALELRGGERVERTNGSGRHRAGAEAPQEAQPSVLPPPAPVDAADPAAHYAHGQHVACWRYWLADSSGIAFLIARYNVRDGKVFAQWTWNGHKWIGKSYPKPRPLYRLRELLALPGLPVLLVEGEKAADAAASRLITHVVVTWPGGGNAVNYADWSPLAGRSVVLWPDADDPGIETMWAVVEQLTKLNCVLSRVVPIERPRAWDVANAVEDGEDIDRLVADAVPIEAAQSKSAKRMTRAQPQRASGVVVSQDGELETEESAFATWDALKLDRIGGGAPFATMANVQIIALLHKKYRGRIYWDTFRMRKMVVEENAEREWTAEDTLHMLQWIQHGLKLPKVTKTHIHDGVDAAAMRNKRNSLTTWLETLEWDGHERLPAMMKEVFHAEDNDYTRAVGRCWLVSMVARAFGPGCQVDTMVVLEGGQGAYKSSALSILGGDYYAALPSSFGNRDFLQALDGMWLIEIPDMSGFKGRDIEHVKAIITTRRDRYCRRYAHDAETYPRQCVFAATANRDDWNEDETGARRFLPVRVGESIDRELLKDLREKYFAEAVYRYRKGEEWWNVPSNLAVQEQAMRRPEDSWEPSVRAAINSILNDPATRDKTVLTISQVFEKLSISLNHQGKAEQMRVARILRDNGWLRKTAWDGEKVSKQWFKPFKEPESE
jgi:putative DNA primase/helicase